MALARESGDVYIHGVLKVTAYIHGVLTVTAYIHGVLTVTAYIHGVLVLATPPYIDGRERVGVVYIHGPLLTSQDLVNTTPE